MKHMGFCLQPPLTLSLMWLVGYLPLVYGLFLADGEHTKGSILSYAEEEPKADGVEPPIVRRANQFHSIGRPSYPDEHPDFTWADLSGHSRGQLGHLCRPESRKQCGAQLVCRQNVCRHCSADSECPSLHYCQLSTSGENLCTPEAKKAWEMVFNDPSHFLCTLLIFFSALLAAAAGTGGGGMFVPLLILFASMKAEYAVPLSQCMIFFSASCNLVAFVAQRHAPPFTSQPKIDYDCIVLFAPMLVLGVTFGVLLHRMSPQWFLLLLLCMTLGMALWRTATKGIKQWMKEREKDQEELAETIGPVSPRVTESRSYLNEIAELTNPKSAHILGIMVVWLLMFVASFHGLSACSWQFGVYFATLAVMLILFTVIATRKIITRPEKSEKPMDWVATNPKEALWFPLVAFSGGFLGGLLGLGGGVVMSPVLVEVGMHSESVQATTVVIVFLSSSIATIQFAILSQIIWHYALWYSFVAVVATLLGQHLCDVYVHRTGRYSLITLAIAGVLLFSLLALSVVGVIKVMEDITYGQQMWFSTSRLCSAANGMGIFDVDLTPAQALPTDLPVDVDILN